MYNLNWVYWLLVSKNERAFIELLESMYILWERPDMPCYFLFSTHPSLIKKSSKQTCLVQIYQRVKHCENTRGNIAAGNEIASHFFTFEDSISWLHWTIRWHVIHRPIYKKHWFIIGLWNFYEYKVSFSLWRHFRILPLTNNKLWLIWDYFTVTQKTESMKHRCTQRRPFSSVSVYSSFKMYVI